MAYVSRFSMGELNVILEGCRPFHDDLVRALVLDLADAQEELETLKTERGEWMALALQGERARAHMTLDLLLHLPLADKKSVPEEP